MSPAIWVPLVTLGCLALEFLGMVVLWRLLARDRYPNCRCWICGRRRR